MTIEKALQILNLNSNYTEEDLKKAYRQLTQKYHPDLHKENQDFYLNTMKDVNNAFDTLKKALKGRASNTESSTTQKSYSESLNMAKNIAINLVKSYGLEEIDRIVEFSQCRTEILNFYQSTIIKLKHANTVSGCLNITNEFERELVKYYQKLQRTYFEYYKINYNGYIDIAKKYVQKSLDSFYDSLKNFKVIYDNVMTIINEFTSWHYYNALKDKVERIRINAIDEIYKTPSSSQVVLINLKLQITAIFKAYSNNIIKYNEILESNKNILDEDIQNEIKMLKNSLTENDFEFKYQKVKDKIDSYYERINNKEEVQKLYEKITVKLNVALGSLNLESDYANINNILNLYRFMLSVIKKYNQGLINFETLKNLDKVTFTSPLEDINIINAINNNSLVVSSNNIYFCKNANTSDEIRLLTYQNGEYKMVWPDNLLMKEIKVMPDEIATNYISLDKFLFEASEFFYHFKFGFNNYLGLYKNADLVLAWDEELKKFLVLSTDIEASNYKRSKVEETIMYKNCEYLKNLVVENLQKRVLELEKKEKNR